MRTSSLPDAPKSNPLFLDGGKNKETFNLRPFRQTAAIVLSLKEKAACDKATD